MRLIHQQWLPMQPLPDDTQIFVLLFWCCFYRIVLQFSLCLRRDTMSFRESAEHAFDYVAFPLWERWKVLTTSTNAVFSPPWRPSDYLVLTELHRTIFWSPSMEVRVSTLNFFSSIFFKGTWNSTLHDTIEVEGKRFGQKTRLCVLDRPWRGCLSVLKLRMTSAATRQPLRKAAFSAVTVWEDLPLPRWSAIISRNWQRLYHSHIFSPKKFCERIEFSQFFERNRFRKRARRTRTFENTNKRGGWTPSITHREWVQLNTKLLKCSCVSSR